MGAPAASTGGLRREALQKRIHCASTGIPPRFVRQGGFWRDAAREGSLRLGTAEIRTQTPAAAGCCEPQKRTCAVSTVRFPQHFGGAVRAVLAAGGDDARRGPIPRGQDQRSMGPLAAQGRCERRAGSKRSRPAGRASIARGIPGFTGHAGGRCQWVISAHPCA